MENLWNSQREVKPTYIVGAKKNPDGSMDYSKSASMIWPKEAGIPDNQHNSANEAPEHQEYVKSILKHLDWLNDLLDMNNFRPEQASLSTHLNMNITGILSFERVLSWVSDTERIAITNKANEVEGKMQQALDVCKSESVKREAWMDGKYVHQSVFNWLAKEGPAVISSLKEL